MLNLASSLRSPPANRDIDSDAPELDWLGRHRALLTIRTAKVFDLVLGEIEKGTRLQAHNSGPCVIM
jgi:hypothetical protein